MLENTQRMNESWRLKGEGMGQVWCRDFDMRTIQMVLKIILQYLNFTV